VTSSDLPEHAKIFIGRLTNMEPRPESIWVIGSRANGRATVSSDTDLLVFGSPELLQTLATTEEAPSGIDCLVVFDGNNYKDPFQDKSGSLSKLEWRPVNASLSQYVGIKWVPDEESGDDNMGDMVHRQERAIRVWPVGT
jgi:hypothetical protein